MARQTNFNRWLHSVNLTYPRLQWHVNVWLTCVLVLPFFPWGTLGDQTPVTWALLIHADAEETNVDRCAAILPWLTCPIHGLVVHGHSMPKVYSSQVHRLARCRPTAHARLAVWKPVLLVLVFHNGVVFASQAKANIAQGEEMLTRFGVQLSVSNMLQRYRAFSRKHSKMRRRFSRDPPLDLKKSSRRSAKVTQIGNEESFHKASYIKSM